MYSRYHLLSYLRLNWIYLIYLKILLLLLLLLLFSLTGARSCQKWNLCRHTAHVTLDCGCCFLRESATQSRQNAWPHGAHRRSLKSSKQIGHPSSGQPSLVCFSQNFRFTSSLFFRAASFFFIFSSRFWKRLRSAWRCSVSIPTFLWLRHNLTSRLLGTKVSLKFCLMFCFLIVALCCLFLSRRVSNFFRKAAVWANCRLTLVNMRALYLLT